MKRYKLSYLKGLKTISESQADDLKIERNGFRVWLSRMSKADGMPYNNQVTIEEYKNGRWIDTAHYQARN